MTDIDTNTNVIDEDGVIFACVGDACWLLEGDQHLGAIIMADAPYPKPIHAVSFASTFELSVFLQTQEVSLASLWSINPQVVARLKKMDELVMISPPSVA